MTTLTEVFPCLFLSCKANSRVKPAKTGHGPHSSQLLCCCMYFLCCSMYFCVVLCIICFVSFSVLFVCICILYYCHRVATQLQLNISYHISFIREKVWLENSREPNLFPYKYSNILKPSHSSYLSAYEDGTQCSETSAYKIQTPGNYPEESIKHSEHGESFKSRIVPLFIFYVITQFTHKQLHTTEPNMFSVSQETLRILRNLSVHYSVHNSPPFVPLS